MHLWIFFVRAFDWANDVNSSFAFPIGFNVLVLRGLFFVCKSQYLWNKYRKYVPCFYLNNRVFLSRNYRLIVAPRKFDVLKTNMLVLRTSNFQGVTIRPIVPRHKLSIVFIVQPLTKFWLNFVPSCAPIQKSYGIFKLFVKFEKENGKNPLNTISVVYFL